ncbi:TolC family protein [bacterium]|nr:TolC family protein [bacterium]
MLNFFGWSSAVALTLATPVSLCASDPFSTAESVSDSAAVSIMSKQTDHVICREDQSVTGELGLYDILQRALCKNPKTREAWENALYQAAQVGSAKSAYLPTLDASLLAERTAVHDGAQNTHTGASLNLGYLLFDFGGREASLKSAALTLDALNQTQESVIQTLFYATVDAYDQYLAARYSLDATKESESSALESFNAAKARYDAGVSTLADMLQTKTAYAQAKLERIRAEGILEITKGSLANQMSIPPDSDFTVRALASTVPEDYENSIKTAMQTALGQRPDLAAAKAQIDAADESVKKARAAGLPKIALNGSLDISDSSQAGSYQSATAGITVSIPIFSGYATTYAIEAAKVQSAIERTRYDAINQQVMLDVWKSYHALMTLTQVYRTSLDLLQSAEASAETALGRYKNGVGTITELLIAQSALASAKVQKIQAFYNWYTARTALAFAMGRLDFGKMKKE